MDLSFSGEAEVQDTHLDETDRAILRVLVEDARTPNNALAEKVGIAPSTCLARVRSLRKRRILLGYHADVDLASVGLSLQAIVAVRLHAQARGDVRNYAQRVARLPRVLDVYFLGGADDFFVHLACASTAELRDFVAEHLSLDPAVSYTQTSIVFDHVRGTAAF